MHAGLQLDTVTTLCCYGLGSPTRSANARAQAALIPLLRAMLPAKAGCEVYDPVFDDDDEAVLTELGCRVLSEHALSERRVVDTTLFYMPHCDAELYNDLLDANWGAAAICNVIIVGNSFENMTVRALILQYLCLRARRRAGAMLSQEQTAPAVVRHANDATGFCRTDGAARDAGGCSSSPTECSP